jgi:hypothetical protein
MSVALLSLWLVEPGEGLRLAARWTGRLGLVFFVPVFLGDDRIGARFTLVFGASHIVHFGWLAAFVATSGIPLVPFRAAGGALGYLVILTLMWFARRALTHEEEPPAVARWARRLGEPYLWIVFAMTYVARIRDPESLRLEPSPIHGILLATALALLPLRAILHWRRARV